MLLKDFNTNSLPATDYVRTAIWFVDQVHPSDVPFSNRPHHGAVGIPQFDSGRRLTIHDLGHQRIQPVAADGSRLHQPALVHRFLLGHTANYGFT